MKKSFYVTINQSNIDYAEKAIIKDNLHINPSKIALSHALMNQLNITKIRKLNSSFSSIIANEEERELKFPKWIRHKLDHNEEIPLNVKFKVTIL